MGYNNDDDDDSSNLLMRNSVSEFQKPCLPPSSFPDVATGAILGDCDSNKKHSDAVIKNKGSGYDCDDWSNLHPDILILIMKKFSFLCEYFRFIAVCKSWRDSVSKFKKPCLPLTQFPFLLLAEDVAPGAMLEYDPSQDYSEVEDNDEEDSSEDDADEENSDDDDSGSGGGDDDGSDDDDDDDSGSGSDDDDDDDDDDDSGSGSDDDDDSGSGSGGGGDDDDNEEDNSGDDEEDGDKTNYIYCIEEDKYDHNKNSVGSEYDHSDEEDSSESEDDADEQNSDDDDDDSGSGGGGDDDDGSDDDDDDDSGSGGGGGDDDGSDDDDNEQDNSGDDEEDGEYDHNKNSVGSSRGLCSLLTGKTYYIDLPEAAGRLILGTNKGWLVTLGRDLQINLLHPLLNHQISLPPMLTFTRQMPYHEGYMPEDASDMFVQKVVVSSSVLDNNTAFGLYYHHASPSPYVMAIYGDYFTLGFARLGDKVWRDVNFSSFNFDDIVYHRGNFYAVDIHGHIFVCGSNGDEEGGDIRGTEIALIESKDWEKKYLVEPTSGSGLLLLVRYRKNMRFKYRTTGFSVWRLDLKYSDSFEDISCSLKEESDLGNESMFVGNASSTAVSSSEIIKPNCIYFTDDHADGYYHIGGGHDMGIFSMEHHTIEPHFQGKSYHPISPPLWYI